MIGQTVSHYKILEKLGEGGMGEVYLAEDLNLGRKVAIKFLAADKAADSEARKRFIHEARAQALVTHTNIATFHEVGEEKGKVFIVMEYIEGQKLSELAKTEKLPLTEVLDLAIQVGEGLQAAHERGVMHRDINPANILVTSKRVPKITDFGLAKWKGASTITKTGLQMGTDSYMSPEQLEGRKADFRTDIFSFGVVLYELICAKRPFEGNNRETLFYEILYSQPQPLARYSRDVPAELERIVFKCLAKKPEERYQSAADLVADLKKERKEIESGQRILLKPKKWLPFLAPAGIGLAVLLFLIFKPFGIKIGTEKEAAAAENSLAIMYFENLADPDDKDRTAQMITSLLITDLSESEYMSVLSQQRLYDILKLRGKEGLKIIDKSTASEVAEKARAKWILTGRLIQAKPEVIVTAEVSEAKGGKILASQRVLGSLGEDLFAVVDKLSAEVKKDLTLQSWAKAEVDRPVADVTTHSPEAYRCYLEGLEFYNKYYYSEAEQAFKKALEYDSTFAMAYFRLAEISAEIGVGESEAETFIAKAEQYFEKVSPKEKYYIKALVAVVAGNFAESVNRLKTITERYPDEKEAYFHLGQISWEVSNLEGAVDNFNNVIALDPMYKPAYNLLALVYRHLGDFEKSIWAINKYIELAPEEANPYDTRGELYASNGKLDLAIASYRMALQKKKDFAYSLTNMGFMHLFKRDYGRAESYFQTLATSNEKNLRSLGRLYLGLMPLFQGKFNEALQILDEGIAADRFERVEGMPLSFKHLNKADIYLEQKNWRMALREAEKAAELDERLRDYYLWVLSSAGNKERVEKTAEDLKGDIERKSAYLTVRWWFADGVIKRVNGKLPEALIGFEKAAKLSPLFPYHFILAESYLKLDRLGEAVSELEKLSVRYDQLGAPTALRLSVKTYYLLGLAYEKSGWNQKAIKSYEEFLEIWKNADPGIPEVEDAKQRLANLKKKV